MKSIQTCVYLLLAAVFAYGCSKSNSGGSGGSLSGSDSISVSGILPAQPYVDDIITINGTNFNPDPTKDTVYFGVLTGTTGANGLPGFTTKVIYQVISATSTQIKVKLPAATASSNPLQTANLAMTAPFDLNNAKGFMIYANGKKKVLTVPFKMLPSFSATRYTPNTITQNNFQQNFAGCIYGTFGAPYLFLYEGDSLLLDGYGLSNITISLNGKPLSGLVTADKGKGQHVAAYVPYGFFGEAIPPVADRCPIIGTRVLTITVTNSDGKTLTSTNATYFPSSNMAIYSYGINAASFSQSNINAQPLYKISGYALHAGITVRISCSRNGSLIYSQIIGTVPGGYPNEVTFPIDMLALPTPATSGDAYSVTLTHDASGAVVKGAGGNGFTLNP